MGDNSDPRLANTGAFVVGREIIDESVLLSDFERLLEIGEAYERDEADSDDCSPDAMWELAGFIDRHGRQLLWLAKRGAGVE